MRGWCGRSCRTSRRQRRCRRQRGASQRAAGLRTGTGTGTGCRRSRQEHIAGLQGGRQGGASAGMGVPRIPHQPRRRSVRWRRLPMHNPTTPHENSHASATQGPCPPAHASGRDMERRRLEAMHACMHACISKHPRASAAHTTGGRASPAARRASAATKCSCGGTSLTARPAPCPRERCSVSAGGAAYAPALQGVGSQPMWAATASSAAAVASKRRSALRACSAW